MTGRVDLPFEALVEVTNANIQAERGALNKALQQIRAAVSDELDDADLAVLIRLRGEQYRAAFEGAALTPPALAKHWSRLEAESKPPPVAYSPPVQGPPRYCDTCGGNRMVLVGYRPLVQTTWMESKGIEPNTREPGYEEWAPCPDCNSEASTDYWRYDRTRFRVMDPGEVRARIGQ